MNDEPPHTWDVISKYMPSGMDRSKSNSDNFISVWIAFNAWMKGKYGSKLTDKELLDKTKTDTIAISAFTSLKKRNANILYSFSKFEIVNKKTGKSNRYKGTLVSLIDALYVIRGNTFHGYDYSGRESELYQLAFAILHAFALKIFMLS